MRSGVDAPSASATLSIVHPWDPWKQAVGGFDTCIDGILRTAPAEWRIELIALSADPAARPVGRWLDLDFDRRPVRFFAALSERPRNRVAAFPLSLRFVAACRRWRVRPSGRIVQFHRFESSLGASGTSAARKVFFLHNHPPEEARPTHNDVRWRHMPGLHRRLLLGRLRLASLVVAVDPRTPAWLEASLPGLRGRVVHLPQWADPSVFYQRPPEDRASLAARWRTDLGLPEGCRIVLFAGRLEAQKDPLLLVRAFARLAASRPDVYLLIAGDGRLAGAVEGLAGDLGVGDRLRWVGSVDRRALAEIYAASDVLACTSAFEAGPRVVFEALACGTPFVSFDVGQIAGLRALEPEAGIVVPQRSEAEFAAALAKSLSRFDGTGTQPQGARVAPSFSPEGALADVYRIYQTWTRERSRRADRDREMSLA